MEDQQVVVLALWEGDQQVGVQSLQEESQGVEYQARLEGDQQTGSEILGTSYDRNPGTFAIFFWGKSNHLFYAQFDPIFEAFSPRASQERRLDSRDEGGQKPVDG